MNIFCSDSQIQSQIDVLNKDYSGSGIAWSLAGTDRTTNDDWFNSVGPDSDSQTTMKEQLRKGDVNALNVYSVGFVSGSGSGLLGYSTFPSDYSSNPKDDGVVMLFSSVPGGSTENYNEGRVSFRFSPSHSTGAHADSVSLDRPSHTKLATGLASTTLSRVAALAKVTRSMTPLRKPLPPLAAQLIVTPALAAVLTRSTTTWTTRTTPA